MLTYDLLLGSYQDVLSDVKADLIFTSPPYNIGTGGPRRDGMRKNGYDVKSYAGITQYEDSLPEDVYQEQQVSFLRWCADHLTPGGTVAYNHKPRRKNKSLLSPWAWFYRVPELTVTDEIVLDRGSTHNNGTGQVWQTTERLWLLRRTDDRNWKLRNQRSRGLDPVDQKDVWPMPIQKRAGGYEAAFDQEVAARAVRLLTEPGQLVCDPYAGSGTTGKAAAELGRSFIGAEISETRKAGR